MATIVSLAAREVPVSSPSPEAAFVTASPVSPSAVAAAILSGSPFREDAKTKNYVIGVKVILLFFGSPLAKVAKTSNRRVAISGQT